MANYRTIDSQYGTFTFDLDRPILFKHTTFPTRAQALEELRSLDERCYPLLRETADGEWAILVHSQEEPSHEKRQSPWYKRVKDRNLDAIMWLWENPIVRWVGERLIWELGKRLLGFRHKLQYQHYRQLSLKRVPPLLP